MSDLRKAHAILLTMQNIPPKPRYEISINEDWCFRGLMITLNGEGIALERIDNPIAYVFSDEIPQYHSDAVNALHAQFGIRPNARVHIGSVERLCVYADKPGYEVYIGRVVHFHLTESKYLEITQYILSGEGLVIRDV
jgi:hypothetical protein